jgi:hypothetical protein
VLCRIVAIQDPKPVVERAFIGESERDRGRFDARNAANSLQACGVEPVDGGASFVAGVLQRSLGGDDISRVEAGVEPVQIAECSQHQPRADQENQTQRHFGRDQCVSPPAAPRAGHTPPRLHQHRTDIQARGLQRGRQSEKEAGERRNPEHRHQHPPIQLDRMPQLEVFGPQALQPIDGECADAHAHGASAQRQQQALDQELPHDGRAAAAQRHARCNLAAAPARPRQQQPGDVHAADQQHHQKGSPGVQ